MVSAQPCFPYPECDDPVQNAASWWPVIAVIGTVSIVLAMVVALVLRPRGQEPLFRPSLPRLLAATMLALGGVLVAVLAFPVKGLIAGIIGVVATAGAFLVTGSSLLPRGSAGRGVLLGAVTYVLVGVAAVTIVHTLLGTSFADTVSEPGPFILGVMLWPVVIGAYVGELF